MTTIFNKGNTTKTMKVYSNKILIESQRLDEAQAVKPEKKLPTFVMAVILIF